MIAVEGVIDMEIGWKQCVVLPATLLPFSGVLGATFMPAWSDAGIGHTVYANHFRDFCF